MQVNDHFGSGANLVTALTVAACYPRSEPYAERVFDTGITPVAVLPACGILQVTDSRRFARRLCRALGGRHAHRVSRQAGERAGISRRSSRHRQPGIGSMAISVMEA